MKRVATVKAKDDDGQKIIVRIEFHSDRHLSVGETRAVIRDAASRVSGSIQELPYSGFKPYNTQVTVA